MHRGVGGARRSCCPVGRQTEAGPGRGSGGTRQSLETFWGGRDTAIELPDPGMRFARCTVRGGMGGAAEGASPPPRAGGAGFWRSDGRSRTTEAVSQHPPAPQTPVLGHDRHHGLHEAPTGPVHPRCGHHRARARLSPRQPQGTDLGSANAILLHQSGRAAALAVPPGRAGQGQAAHAGDDCGARGQAVTR
jgi:hypothetical protein